MTNVMYGIFLMIFKGIQKGINFSLEHGFVDVSYCGFKSDTKRSTINQRAMGTTGGTAVMGMRKKASRTLKICLLLSPHMGIQWLSYALKWQA